LGIISKVTSFWFSFNITPYTTFFSVNFNTISWLPRGTFQDRVFIFDNVPSNESSIYTSNEITKANTLLSLTILILPVILEFTSYVELPHLPQNFESNSSLHPQFKQYIFPYSIYRISYFFINV